MAKPLNPSHESRWTSDACGKLSAMLRDAAAAASKPLGIGAAPDVQWASQADGRERLLALLAAFSLAGPSELERAATDALADLTLRDGGSCAAMGAPGRDAGLAWTISELARAGAATDHYDEQGWAPIHQQSCMGHALAVAALVEAGAHPGLETRRSGHPSLPGATDGHATRRGPPISPADYAREGGHDDLADWLDAQSAARAIERESRKRALWIVELHIRREPEGRAERAALAFELPLGDDLAHLSRLAASNPGNAWRAHAQSPATPLPRNPSCSAIFSKLSGQAASASVQDPSIFARAASGYEFVGVQRISIGGPIRDGVDAAEECSRALALACKALARCTIEPQGLLDSLSPFAAGAVRLPGIDSTGFALSPKQAEAIDSLAARALSGMEKAALLRAAPSGTKAICSARRHSL